MLPGKFVGSIVGTEVGMFPCGVLCVTTTEGVRVFLGIVPTAAVDAGRGKEEVADVDEDVLVGLGVAEGVLVGLGVGEGVLVGLGVGDGVLVGLGVGEGVLVGLGIGEGVLVGLGIGDGVLVGLGVGEGVLVGLGVGVLVEVGEGVLVAMGEDIERVLEGRLEVVVEWSLAASALVITISLPANDKNSTMRENLLMTILATVNLLYVI